MSQTIVFPVRKWVAEHLTMTVRVKGWHVAKFRVRCAIALVWLASKIAGTKYALEIERA
jgi:hypothetical protein